MDITVDTGPQAASPPRGFFLGNRYIAVSEILDQWPGEGYLYLKVRAGDDGVYLLRREDATDRWQLWMYQAGQATPVEPLSGS